LLKSKSPEVIIVEGEKDVENLQILAFRATTAPIGCGKWRPEYNGERSFGINTSF
jgi:hypothetical protein